MSFKLESVPGKSQTMSSITIKTQVEISLLREGGHKLSTILKKVADMVRPGITTLELNTEAERLAKEAGGEPAFLGYKGYPASLCTSINEEIVHGIPGSRVLVEGDIIGLDMGMRYKGLCTDAAITVPVGKIDQENMRLLLTVREALNSGIAKVKAGAYLGDIGAAIQQQIERHGFSVVRDLVGHGIGVEVHEEPQVPNFGKKGTGIVLREGMVICLEPMANIGSHEVKVQNDGWTVVTKDGKRSAHFEHTVLALSSGFEILTK